MDPSDPSAVLDDVLALENVAVGPYCVFDDFRPEDDSANPDSPTESTPLDDPIMSTDYAFSTGMRAPWLASTPDDLSLQSADAFQQANWEEWMRWDPQASQSFKDADGPVPAQYLKAEVKTPAFEQHSDSPPMPPDAARANMHFTFGQSMDNSHAFQFDNQNRSPMSNQGQPINPQSYTENPVWTENDRLQQNDDGLFSPLPFDQQQMQMNGAPPPPQSTPSLQHSPSSVTDPKTSSSSNQSSPEPVSGPNKKRKSSTEDESSDQQKNEKQPPVKKAAHNMIEKRYRTNLNDKIAALRDSVPSLRVMSRTNGGDDDDDHEDLEGLTPAHKLNKATVLSKATEYIRHLEKRNKRLSEEVDGLKARLESYDKFAMGGPMGMAQTATTPDGMRYQEDPFAAAAARGQPVPQAQGMIPVPESITNLQQAMAAQQHYVSQANGYPVYSTAQGRQGNQQQPMVNRRGNQMMNKLMVGSLAGLMVVEGWRERESSGENPEGRGLFALPIHLLGYGSAFVPRFAAQGLSALYKSLPLIKLFLVLAAFVYLILPFLDFKPKSKKKAAPIKLSPAPSPASPVEVRRKAWLTAIQTVWVPRHNFFLEAAAVSLKALKLSLRNVVGWDGYAYLTGTTQEHEAARVKAWDIALDAQLTGGDAEISKGRLVLTIMASGTLPDTPARLMLKAMHVRVLLWEVANAGYGSWYMFDEISAKIARSCWRKAQNLQKAWSAGKGDPAEKLPEHLAALLDLGCDDVMVDKIVQRAYNLAWNKSSAQNTDPDEAMDSVVEDFAISSPLDALAAWFSSYVLNRSLVQYLESNNAAPSESIKADLELAMRTAPSNSFSHVRALVARAILMAKDRNASIIAAFDALPSQPHIPALKDRLSPRAMLMHVENEDPMAADVRKSLTLVKCLALAKEYLHSGSDEARQRSTFVVNNTFLPESRLTLLSFVAAYKVLVAFSDDASLLAESRQGLERVAGSVRVWIGREAGRRSGLSNKTKGRIVETCVAVSKTLVGMHEGATSDEGDAGYASQSDGEPEGVKIF
ncbi:hypothetical protein IWZ00DRAFT_300349 [Phyllosticta capitalensis]